MKLESTITEKAGFLYLTPILDGILLLLVFFILSSAHVHKSGVEVSLPHSQSNLPKPRQTHIITVMDGSPPKIYFNESRVDLTQLEQELQSKKTTNQVTILADRDTVYGAVMEVAVLALKEDYEVFFGTQSGEE